MFQDEARFGRISDPGRCWAPKGIRPEVGSQIIREYVYVFGAVSPSDGHHDSLILPSANTDAMSVFLEEVARRHAGEKILMFMDQASWHKTESLPIPANMRIAFLPPYSPDLNPQEQIWDELREKFFRNRTFESLEAVMDNAVKGLQALESVPEKIRSLTHRNWILNPL
jgi:transposase